MGERARALCHLSDGTWVEYHSQWAGNEEILDRILESDCLDQRLALLAGYDWHPETRYSRGCASRGIDYLDTAVVYTISSERVEPFLSFWFGLPLVDGPVSPALGVLVSPCRNDSVSHDRLRFQQLKAVLQEAIGEGLITMVTAWQILFLWFDDRVVHVSNEFRHLDVDL